MRRIFVVAFWGSLMALGSSSLLHAQDVRPISYEDLLARLETVESELAARPNYAVGSVPSYRENSRRVRGGLFATYENVWIKPYFSHNEAYQVMDDLPAVGESARGEQFNWGFESSPRIEFGYIAPCTGVGWRARYWQFDSSTSRSAVDPGVGRLEVGLQDDPDIEVSTADDESLRATHALKLDVVDLELMKRRESACSSLTFGGGLRYLRMDQDYDAVFADVNTGVVDDILSSYHSFEGIGPTLAMEGTRRMGSSYLSLFGKTRGSILLGDSSLEQARVDPQTPATPVRELVSFDNDTDFQFIAELQAGVRYERRLSNGSTPFGSLGAEVQYWPSGGSGSVQRGEDDGTTGDPRDSDMLLLGLSTSVGLMW